MLGQLGPLAAVAGHDLGLKTPGDLYVGLLGSRTIADLVIDHFKLKSVYKAKTMVDARSKLRNAIKFSTGKDSLVRVEVNDPDPKRAAGMANLFVAELNRKNTAFGTSEAAQRRAFLKRQVYEEKDELAAAEDAMKSTQAKTGIIQVEAQTTVAIASVAQLKAQITAGEVALERLKMGATAQNPEVVKAEAELAALRSQRKDLEETSHGGSDPILATAALPHSGLEYVRRLRDLKYHEFLFEMLSKQYEAARIDESKAAPAIQIVESRCLPRTKKRPHRGLVIAFGIVAGLILGSMAAYLEHGGSDPEFGKKAIRGAQTQEGASRAGGTDGRYWNSTWRDTRRGFASLPDGRRADRHRKFRSSPPLYAVPLGLAIRDLCLARCHRSAGCHDRATGLRDQLSEMVCRSGSLLSPRAAGVVGRSGLGLWGGGRRRSYGPYSGGRLDGNWPSSPVAVAGLGAGGERPGNPPGRFARPPQERPVLRRRGSPPFDHGRRKRLVCTGPKAGGDRCVAGTRDRGGRRGRDARRHFASFRPPRISLALVRGMLPYGIPLVWSALVGVGMDASGRYLLARHTGLDQVAVYTVALKISAVMQVGFLQPFGTAWSGIMFQISRDQDAPRSVTSILSVAFVAAMTLAAGISIVAPLALALFGNTIYYRAAVLIPWLLLPPAFRILEYWSSLGLYLTHRTGWLAGAATGEGPC